MKPYNAKKCIPNFDMLRFIVGAVFLAVFVFLPLPSYSQIEIVTFYVGDLIRAEDDHRVYVLTKGGTRGKRRWIRNIEVFNSYNFKWEDVRVVPPIVLPVFEFTNLLRQQGDERVYLINETGFKRHIPSPQVFASYGFDWNDVAVVPSVEVESYPQSRLIRKEGDAKVYLIENSTKRWIESAEVFNSQGFDWNEIQVVNNEDISFFKTGQIITPQAPKVPPPAPEPVKTKEKPQEEAQKEITTSAEEPVSATTTEPSSDTTPEPIATVPVPVPTPTPSGGGGGGGTSTPAADTTAPSAVADLSASNPTTSSIDLSWTSPGDDASTGTATTYDVRYSTSNITDSNWASATQITGEPTPKAAGSPESMTVSGLSAGTTYYFAIKSKDEAGNESGISNVVTLATASSSDTTAPAAITNLSASNPTASSVDLYLSWTSPGDDASSGTATTYDVRYSTSNITDSNWASATQITGEPTPKAAGSPESMTVSGLSAGTTYYFAIKTKDEAGNESGISNVVTLATAPSDTTAPSAIASLSTLNPTTNSITPTWRAPGDDAYDGTATSYDLRYSTSNITDANWASATQVSGEPTPQVAESVQSMTISGLSSETTYYFAIKTKDEAGNESGLSNIASRATKSCISLASGSQTYSVSSGAGQPRIQGITLNPLDFQPGSSQTVSVTARDTNNNDITSMNVTFTTDSGSNTISLPPGGSTTSGTWSASWTPTDTHCATYSVKVTAVSASGTSIAELSLQ